MGNFLLKYEHLFATIDEQVFVYVRSVGNDSVTELGS